jgi:leucyl-tRNA synthetase
MKYKKKYQEIEKKYQEIYHSKKLIEYIQDDNSQKLFEI